MILSVIYVRIHCQIFFKTIAGIYAKRIIEANVQARYLNYYPCNGNLRLLHGHIYLYVRSI